eukprot:m51a1_g5769 hypothetical protein (479) ;mRNA; r:1240135-1241653
MEPARGAPIPYPYDDDEALLPMPSEEARLLASGVGSPAQRAQSLGRSVGWSAFAPFHSLVSVVVHATLFPKVLQERRPGSFVAAFVAATLATDALAALALPLVGCAADALRRLRAWMIAAEVISAAACFAPRVAEAALPARCLAPATTVAYFVSGLALRVGVTSNNALLNCFERQRRVSLSLAAGAAGSAAALAGLAVLWFSARGDVSMSTTSFAAFYAGAALVPVVLTTLAPSGPFDRAAPRPGAPPNAPGARGCWPSAADGARRVWRTLGALAQRPMAPSHCVLWFLLANVFSSAASSVYATFLVALYIDVHYVTLSEGVVVMMWYVTAVVGGTLLGIVFRFFVPKHVACALVVQTAVLTACLAAQYAAEVLHWGYTASIALTVLIGLLGGWHSTLSRGFMARLAPDDRKGEFFGLFSASTYMGSMAASACFLLARGTFGCNTRALCLVLAYFSLPSYFFYALLFAVRHSGQHRDN